MRFRTASDEDLEKICRHFQTIVEEFGPNHVQIALPQEWRSLTKKNCLGRVPVEFSLDDQVSIRVAYAGQTMEFSYKVI